MRTAASADEGAFAFDSRMAGYGAEATPERPTDDACERRFMADSASSTKGSEADIREDWDELANDRNGR